MYVRLYLGTHMYVCLRAWTHVAEHTAVAHEKRLATPKNELAFGLKRMIEFVLFNNINRRKRYDAVQLIYMGLSYS